MNIPKADQSAPDYTLGTLIFRVGKQSKMFTKRTEAISLWLLSAYRINPKSLAWHRRPAGHGSTRSVQPPSSPPPPDSIPNNALFTAAGQARASVGGRTERQTGRKEKAWSQVIRSTALEMGRTPWLLLTTFPRPVSATIPLLTDFWTPPWHPLPHYP